MQSSPAPVEEPASTLNAARQLRTVRDLCHDREASESRYEESFVDLTGARVHYLHAGSGKPLLLIHGLIGSSANWRNNIGALARYASVYAIDLVNVAESQRAADADAGLSA